MKSLICPCCGENLIEDAWEELSNSETGNILIDTYPAYICKAQCGYVKRVEEVPEIIAQQDEDRLLLYYPEQNARILDLRDSVLWPPMHVDSILAKSEWEEYKGNHDIEKLIENARDSRSAYLERPNLFEFATSELSQDAFLCWLMSWSEEPYRSLDKLLYETANEFISAIFALHNIPAPVIETITIQRQFKSLDILTIINNTYAILIEDKTYTKNHSNQLIRYREEVENEYPDLTQLPIYYKIGDQSHYRSVIEAEYAPFTRQMMLRILKNGRNRGITNTIFLDYYRHLQQLEEEVSSFQTRRVSEWNSNAWQGFYKEIQKEIDGDWDYVSNQSGGFLGFWWGSKRHDRYYFQLEEEKLCVKIIAKEGENRKELRNAAMKEVLDESKRHDLQLERPARLGNGKTMTIAQRTDYLQLNNDGTLDLERTLEQLRKY
ncbi:PD-(D/E)XK nuclease superfamily protein [Gracilibacillus ureilyticus]|uniref:PD-(D/E)XK nuclease superfamily protein n=1 Tax=Gracilibacillus ureilyticus TaxID=531814 RepID=A0A1H9UL46_9BACI|nr:PD-(D/E)XK nuclease family protein [Gracilibacillus ureilyticus]SES09904.1 PD-(D/E)XK nuclease superfamily protein [Gracilibacillus ureilyticus]